MYKYNLYFILYLILFVLSQISYINQDKYVCMIVITNQYTIYMRLKIMHLKKIIYANLYNCHLLRNAYST